MLFDGLKRIHSETGIKLRHINLGGGFPVDYLRGVGDLDVKETHREMFAADFEPARALDAAWHAIRENIGSEDSSHLFENLTILLEPGRSIIADAGICLTTVRNAKQRPTSSPPYEGGVAAASADGVVLSDHRPSTTDHWLLTDAGFNILLSMETYKWYYHLISAERPDAEHDFPYKVAGPLCDGGDVYFDIEGEGRLPEHRLLPTAVKPGEILALLNCGAYSLAQASQYNGRLLPAVVLIGQHGDSQVVRHRDTFESLVDRDV